MSVTTHEANVLGEDPFATATLLDPYPFLGRLRDAGAVSYLESTGSYAVAGYQEVYEVLTDFETYISSGGLGPRDIRKDSGWRPPSILESDPPIHTVMRRALTGVINPGTVRALREPFTPPAVELTEQLRSVRGSTPLRTSPRSTRCVCSRTLWGFPTSGGNICC